MTSIWTRNSVALLVAVLSSCSGMSTSGPSGMAIDQAATVHVSKSEKTDRFNYVLLDISKAILPFFDVTFATSLAKGFSGGPSSAPGSLLGVGDVVQVSVFESQSGGLFIPQDAGSRPGNYITLPAQTIDRTGVLKVPYAGEVKAAGRSVNEVQRDIESRLANRAIEPQVVITTTTARYTTASILGDVNKPGKYDLNPAGDKVLDIISQAGGLLASAKETYVTIERKGRKETAAFSTIIDKPSENVYIRPGDTIYVNRDRRTYGIFGAANTNGRINFEEADLTLAEALAQGGGLLDSRAEPEQVFLYRQVSRKTLESMGVDISQHPEEMIPVIFKANLRDPDTFFALQKFKMQDKDVIYVANSAAAEFQKFLTLLNGVTSSASSIASTQRTLR